MLLFAFSSEFSDRHHRLILGWRVVLAQIGGPLLSRMKSSYPHEPANVS
jgi:hypothetical protein